MIYIYTEMERDVNKCKLNDGFKHISEHVCGRRHVQVQQHVRVRQYVIEHEHVVEHEHFVGH